MKNLANVDLSSLRIHLQNVNITSVTFSAANELILLTVLFLNFSYLQASCDIYNATVFKCISRWNEHTSTHWPLGTNEVDSYKHKLNHILTIIWFYSVIINNLITKNHICREAVMWRFPHDAIHDKSAVVQVMAWCRQAPSHYLNQCWQGSITP